MGSRTLLSTESYKMEMVMQVMLQFANTSLDHPMAEIGCTSLTTASATVTVQSPFQSPFIQD